ncbi:MAG: hypothetical protein V4629_03290 [Pseudomonadota bacterium]
MDNVQSIDGSVVIKNEIELKNEMILTLDSLILAHFEINKIITESVGIFKRLQRLTRNELNLLNIKEANRIKNLDEFTGREINY